MDITTNEIKKINRDRYTKSAIVGYWRMGAETKLISLITGIEEFEVEQIIYQYQNKTQCNQHNNKFMAV